MGGGECALGCTVQQQRLVDHGVRPSVSTAVADADVVTEAAQSITSVFEPGLVKQVQSCLLSCKTGVTADKGSNMLVLRLRSTTGRQYDLFPDVRRSRRVPRGDMVAW